MIIRYAYALDSGGATGTPCFFAPASGISSSASFYQETENISGAAGAVVTIQVTTYTNNNTMGELLVNGSLYFLNNTFTVTLDGSGNGSFLARVQGDPGQSGTVVRAIFTITSVTIGQTGSPVIKQISKVF